MERIRRAGQVAWAVCGLAALLALLLLLGWVVRVIWPPLILAGAIVFLLNPVVTRLQHRHIPRAAGTALSYLAVVGVVTLAGFLIAPQANRQYDDLAAEYPKLREKVENWVDDVAERSEANGWPIKVPTFKEIEDQLSNDTAPDANGDGRISDDERQERFAATLATAREVGLKIFHVGLIFILAPIIAFYLLVDLPHLRKVADELVPERARPDVEVLARRLNRAIGGYFRGQLAIATIVGTMVSIGLAILDLPFWLIVGLIAGMFNMIPLIGPYIGAVPGVIIALTTRDFGTALWVVAIMTGAQQIDNHFISPLVMQRAVKLHPAVVMLALLAGGTLGGFFGLLLAVPTTAVLKILVSHLWRTYVLGEPIEVLAAEWEADDATPVPGGVVEPVTGAADEEEAGS